MSELKFTADIDVKILDQKLKKIEENFTTLARDAAQAGSVIDKIFKQTATDSISGMALKLDELRNAYYNLSAADRATKGAGLFSEINSLSAQIETAKNLFVGLEVEAVGSIDNMVAKLGELNRQFNALSAIDRTGSIGTEMQKEIQILTKSIEEAKGEFVSMEQVAEDSINGMITKLIELQRQYNNLSAADRVTIGAGLQTQMQGLSTDIENAKKQFVSLQNVSEDSIDGMTAKLFELNKQFKQLSASDRSGSVGAGLAQDMAMLSNQIENANMKMRAMQGQAKSSTSSLFGLNNSIQQIGRELPNIAYGFPLFIMAISNNLPILTDSIAMARKENELLKQSGQTATPIWKQVSSAIFSWQTAMILGVTALTVFGDKIPGLISDLFRMKDGLKLTSEEMKTLNESFAKSAGSEIGKLNTLFDALANAKEGTEEYADAKAKIIDQYSKNLEGMDAEITSLQNQKAAYDELAKSIYETAKAKSLEELQAGLQEKLIKETTPKFEQLSKLLTGGVGEVYRETILDAARFGKELSVDAQRVIDSFSKKEYQVKTTISGEQVGEFVDVNPVADLIKQIKKEQDDLNQAWKEGNNYADLVFGKSSQQKIKNLTKEAEDALKSAKLMPQGNEAEIAKRNQAIEEAEKRLEYLKNLGIEKDGDYKKTTQELAKAREDLFNAIIANDQKEIKFQSAKIALLEKEKELREWIAYEAVAFAKGDISQADRNAANSPTAIVSKGISPILQKGGLGINTKGQLVEITAVDKTAPTFKKVGLEFGKLNKKQKDIAKDAAKDQEKLDEEELKRKEDNLQKLIDYSREFTSELIDQLGLTEDQSKVLNGMADTLFNLAKGDYLAAAFSIATTAITAALDTSGTENRLSRPWEEFENWISRSNDALERYIKLRDEAIGSERYSASDAAIQEAKVIKADAEARLAEMKLSFKIVGEDSSYKDAEKQLVNQRREIEKELGGELLLEKTTELLLPFYKKLTGIFTYDVADLLTDEKGNFSLEKLQKLIDEGIIADQQVIDAVNAYNANADKIIQLQKEKQELLTATMASSIADSIIDGFRQGYDSAADFADNFEQLMADAVLNAVKIKYLEEPLRDWYAQFAKDMESDGGLDENEKEKLKEWWDRIAAGGIAASNAALDTAGIKTTVKQSGATGIAASATEDTVSAMVGQMMALRVDTSNIKTDVRTMLNFSQNQLEIMDQQLSTLNQIERNTRPLFRLEAIESELRGMHQTLKTQL